MTSQTLYMKPLPVCRATYTLYRKHHSHYLCPHTHCIDNITLILYDITLTICVASFALYKTSHPNFMTSDHRVYVITTTLSDIVSTLSVSSHPLYWWHHTNCISEVTSALIHDIIPIVYDMTATVWQPQPLHSWHEIPYIWHHLQGLWPHVFYTVTSQTLCFWIHVNYI